MLRFLFVSGSKTTNKELDRKDWSRLVVVQIGPVTVITRNMQILILVFVYLQHTSNNQCCGGSYTFKIPFGNICLVVIGAGKVSEF